jgi:hypothetical protein
MVCIEPCFDLLRWVGVGKKKLDCLKAIFRSGLEAVQKGDLVKQHGQVCGKLRHVNPLVINKKKSG